MLPIKSSLTIKQAGSPFPNANFPARIATFTYSGERMGTAPSITATLYYPQCLDNLWTKNEYVELNGEKFYVRQVPTSSKSNEDLFYKHEITFVSERDVLERTFFLDVVAASTLTQYKDRVRSNYTTFSFYGTIVEFAARLSDSMVYSGLCSYDAATKTFDGYHVVIDEDILSDEDIISTIKEVSLDKAYLNAALQEIHDTFELSYYFVGKVCHIGYQQTKVSTILEYGKNNGLLTIAKTNAEYAIIDRITGVGSSDNIPYYYPNDSPDGTAIFSVSGISESLIEKIDLSMLLKNISDPYTTFGWRVNEVSVVEPSNKSPRVSITGRASSGNVTYGGTYYSEATMFNYKITGDKACKLFFYPKFVCEDGSGTTRISKVVANGTKVFAYSRDAEEWDGIISFDANDSLISVEIYVQAGAYIKGGGTVYRTIADKSSYDTSGTGGGFTYGDEGFIPYASSGIVITDTSQLDASTFSLIITGRKYITPCSNLMPSCYRDSEGELRFYNALNNTYGADTFLPLASADETPLTFNNPFVAGNPHEGAEDFDDIKPSIKDVANAAGELYGEIAAIAYDDNDNDALVSTDDDSSDEYEHSWFYIKLHKFNGSDIAFNLFDYALEGEEAYIEMTDGNCAACKFEIGVLKQANSETLKYDFYNPVLVDANGNLLSGDFADKITKDISSVSAAQQNTITNEVWLAVKKDNDTYGVVLPNVTHNYKPQVGNHFVITGIKLPKPLIVAAEKRLDAQLIKYMKENNDEKFNFSITFSRVWLATHPDFAAQLNENSQMQIRYNGTTYPLYVSSFTCKADDNTLYEISVELTDTLTIGQSGLQKQAEAIEDDILSSVGAYTKKGDIATQGQKYFLRRDINDTAAGHLTLNGGFSANSAAFFSANAGSKDFDPDLITGKGWRITPSGDFIGDSLTLRKFLEVPELRYNRAEVILGDEWQAPGGGIIESVSDITDTTDSEGNTVSTGTAVLHLEEGEIGAVAVGDICMGYWHFEGSSNSNAAADSDDNKGNMTHAGFTTVYFKVLTVDTDNNNASFTYQLRQASDTFTNAGYHPQPAMHFVAYGNANDTSRQKSAIRTKTYTRYLAGVKDYEYTTEEIMMQFGDLSGLVIDNVQMSGYSGYLNNIYMSGTIKQLDEKIKAAAEEAAKDKAVTIDKTKTGTVYMTSTDGVNHPAADSASWQADIPEVADGEYLWSKTTVTYSDGTSTVSYSVSSKGKQGDSVTITNKSVTYAVTTLSTQPADSAFTYTSVPAVALGEYLWSKTEITYSPGGTVKSYSVSRVGSDGETVEGHSSYLHIAYASSADGKTGFSTTYFEGATYMGTCVTETSADPSSYSEYTWVRIKGEDATAPALITLTADSQVLRYGQTDGVQDTTPSPTSITVTAAVQNIDSPTYLWSYKRAGEADYTPLAGSASTLTIAHDSALWTIVDTIQTGTDGTTQTIKIPSNLLTIRCSAGGVSDEITLAKLYDGTAGENGEDAITVILTNESHTFAAGESAVEVAQSAQCDILAYKGTKQVGVTIGTVTTGNTKLTTTIYNDTSTLTATVIFNAAVGLATRSGTVSIPLTIDGKTLDRIFSWALSFKGEQGEKGDPGADGKDGADGLSPAANLLLGSGFNTARDLARWTVKKGFTSTDYPISTAQKTFYSDSNTSSDSDLDFLKQVLCKSDGSESRLLPETWHTLSFYLRGYGAENDKMSSYVYFNGGGPVDTSVKGYVDGVEKELSADGCVTWDTNTGADGATNIGTTDNGWVRHSVTFKTGKKVCAMPNLLLSPELPTTFISSGDWISSCKATRYGKTKIENQTMGVIYSSSALSSSTATEDFAGQTLNNINQGGKREALNAGKWYTLSFYAKANSATSLFRSHLYGSAGSAVDSSEKMYVDGVEKTGAETADWSLTTSYARHTLIFKAASNVGTQTYVNLLFRRLAGCPIMYLTQPQLEEGFGVSQFNTGGVTTSQVLFRLPAKANNVAIACPKLEVGKQATPWSLADDEKVGLDGCVYRTTEWAAGVEYRNDSDVLPSQTETGVRYIDVVIKKNKKGEVSGMWQCLEKHTASTDNEPQADTTTQYWKPFNTMAPIYTALVMAAGGVINFLQSNQILIQDSKGNIRTILSGGDHPLIIGGDVDATSGLPTYDNSVIAFNSDGSGKLAGGNINWDASGDLHVSQVEGLQRHKVTTITDENKDSYLISDNLPAWADATTWRQFDFVKTGMVIIFRTTSALSQVLCLPHYDSNTMRAGVVTEEYQNYARSFLGNVITIINESGGSIEVNGAQASIGPDCSMSRTLEKGKIMQATCTLATVAGSASGTIYENIYWKCTVFSPGATNPNAS